LDAEWPDGILELDFREAQAGQEPLTLEVTCAAPDKYRTEQACVVLEDVKLPLQRNVTAPPGPRGPKEVTVEGYIFELTGLDLVEQVVNGKHSVQAMCWIGPHPKRTDGALSQGRLAFPLNAIDEKGNRIQGRQGSANLLELVDINADRFVALRGEYIDKIVEEEATVTLDLNASAPLKEGPVSLRKVERQNDGVRAVTLEFDPAALPGKDWVQDVFGSGAGTMLCPPWVHCDFHNDKGRNTGPKHCKTERYTFYVTFEPYQKPSQAVVRYATKGHDGTVQFEFKDVGLPRRIAPERRTEPPF
jgi:hypothetical protein